uniref:K Homology domain-containing protein n=1 Tax=Setaria digitata TaxID=48799 RepID=A0A915PZC7_9BILA
MSDSGKNDVTEGVASLNIKQSEVTEDSQAAGTMRTITDGNQDGARNKEKASTAVIGAESGDCAPQRTGSALGAPGRISTVPPKFQFFRSSRPYLTREANAEYLARLIKEKEDLKALPNSFHFKHAVRLVDNEIAKMREGLGQMLEVQEDRNDEAAARSRQETTKNATSTPTNGKKIFLQEKIFVPVNEYPNYNFVGRILGPRGMTAKQLEEESGCRIMIRGRGSMREDGSHRQSMYNDQMKEELHVLVQCEDFEEVAKAKVKRAVECIRYMLIPPPEGEDELKRKQLMELSIINGTYRPTNASRIALNNRSQLSATFNFAHNGGENSVRGVNNPAVYANGTIEDDKRTAFFDPRAGVNLPYGPGQHYPYNAYTVNTRQALASLGFDMDAFEVADCCGKRMGKAPAGGQVAAAATIPPATQYPRPYGISTPVMDPFGMQYMWNPPINPAMFGVFDNSTNAIAKEYCNQVMAGLSPAINGNATSIGDGMAQTSNALPVNLQQYITAAALLSGTSAFRNDGSGDGPSNQH